MKIDVSKLDLKNIKDPSFVKDLTEKELVLLSSRIREEILNVVSNNGGHLSSNLGVVELTLALYRQFDFSKDKLIFDVGHQCYTHKILTGRDLTTLRKQNGISGFIKSKESKYDVFESGHSSTSISAAYAYAIDRDNKNEKYDIVVVIGDASIVNGVSLEGLNDVASKEHKIIVILNDNDMSISASVGSVSNVLRDFSQTDSYEKFKNRIKKIFKYIKPIYFLLRSIKNYFKKKVVVSNMFSSIGYSFIGNIDGHNFKSLYKGLRRAKKSKNSCIVHVRTKKGKGYSFAEKDNIGKYHGIKPFNLENGELIDKKEGLITYTKYYSQLVENKLNEDEKFYVISPATLTGGNLINLKKKYKKRVIDVGIAEEHAFVLASTLAKLNNNVLISIYSTFMQRSIDQISHDIARINSPLVVLVDHSGLVGDDGETHQGIYDEAYLFSTPNVNIYMPFNLKSAKSIFKESFASKKPSFIRVPIEYEKEEKIDKDESFVPYIFKNNNSKNLIITLGPKGDEILKIIKKFDIVLLQRLRPIEIELINKIFKYENIVFYTPYETKEGVANHITSLLIEKKYKGNIYYKCIPNEFILQASIEEQFKKYKLDIDSVIKFLKTIK